MPFVFTCCCPFHEEWSHADVDIFRSCSREETRLFDSITGDTKNKGRKRKICVACREKLQNENLVLESQNLEVS